MDTIGVLLSSKSMQELLDYHRSIIIPDLEIVNTPSEKILTTVERLKDLLLELRKRHSRNHTAVLTQTSQNEITNVEHFIDELEKDIDFHSQFIGSNGKQIITYRLYFLFWKCNQFPLNFLAADVFLIIVEISGMLKFRKNFNSFSYRFRGCSRRGSPCLPIIRIAIK